MIRALLGGGCDAFVRLTTALADLRPASPCRCAVLTGYRQVQVIVATSGASRVTMRGFGMFSEFGGAVHGSTHTPASSISGQGTDLLETLGWDDRASGVVEV